MSNEPSKAVLITGCSSGIGRATAIHLATRGYPVYASARRVAAIEDLTEKGCRLLEVDVCNEASMANAVGAIEARHGAVGILVNNAGYAADGPVEEVAIEEVRRQFETNVFGLIRLTQLVLPGMRRQRFGKIVNLSSMGGRMTLPGGGVYHATKYAVEALSDALRFEVKGFGIDVILVEPGVIKTDFGKTAIAGLRAVGNRQAVYDGFRRTLERAIGDLYDGKTAWLAAEPEAIARKIERAIGARRPRDRYPVTLHARLLMGLRKWLGARAFEAIIGSQYQRPTV